MTDERVLFYARRIAVRTAHDKHPWSGKGRGCGGCEEFAKLILPILQEAIVEMAESAGTRAQHAIDYEAVLSAVLREKEKRKR